MSAVIKFGPSAERIGRFDPAAPSEGRVPARPAREAVPRPDPEREERRRLEAENRTLAARLRELERARPDELKAACEEARREGEAAAADREAERLRAVAEATERALERHRERLDGLDRLAAVLAREALAAVFEDASLFRSRVEESLARQLSELDRELVTHVRLSARDFPDQAALDSLAARFPDVRIDCGDRPAGSCAIALTLGAVDAAPGGQWTRLSALLDEMAESGQ